MQNPDEPEIAGNPSCRICSNEPSPNCAVKFEFPLKCRAPFPDEIIAGVLLAGRCRLILGWGLLPGSLRGKQRELRDIEFRMPRTSRQLFDRASVAISSWEIHCGKVSLVTQRRIDEADTLD